MLFIAFAIGAGLLLIAGGAGLGVDSRDGWNVDPTNVFDFDAIRRTR